MGAHVPALRRAILATLDTTPRHAADLAPSVHRTASTVHRHLQRLEAMRLAHAHREPRREPGRPRVLWTAALTPEQGAP